MTSESDDTLRVLIWKGTSNVENAPDTDPDEIVEVPVSEGYVWQDDPWYHSPPVGFHIHPDDRPARLDVYTNDSVREPHKNDLGEWNGPIERGLEFTDKYPEPFGCEVWGRVLFHVERLEDGE